MKRGGLIFAALLLIGGVLRLTGPAAVSPEQQGAEALTKTQNKLSQGALPKIPYLEKFAGKIMEFYGLQKSESAKGTDLASYFQALHTSSDHYSPGPVQFAIALLPDPVHTRLGLFFDRSAEALQQAAQMKGYVFDRAILPWDYTAHTEPSDLKTRQEENDERKQRESYPGLLIFRRSEKPEGDSSRPDRANLQKQDSSALPSAGTPEGPLFVLVVGETPTAGLNRLQFQNAVRIIREIRGSPVTAGAAKPPLLILGPSFSGSLESLYDELRKPDVAKISAGKFIYSGTVTSTGSILRFEQQLGSLPGSHFASFQQNDDYARDEFLKFAVNRGYELREVAVLSEDETVYGSTHATCTQGKAQAAYGQECAEPNSFDALDQEVLKLHFPREISYFRSAYQKETAGQQPTPSRTSGVSTLVLDLQVNGNDEDSVAPYAATQTSLSQEAVMLGIVNELQKHHIKFTLLLASDPLDELFLAGYLRNAYAQGRVVVTAPDLLFSRAGDPALRGVLGLNTYALIPGLSDSLCRQAKLANWHEDRLFVSSLSVGSYNAMVGLLSLKESAERGWHPDEGSGDRPTDSLPEAPYADYGSPGLLGVRSNDICQERPLLWLTILGRDGFWPVTALTGSGLDRARGLEPIAYLDKGNADGLGPPNTLKIASGQYSFLAGSQLPEAMPRTPPAWNVAYCVCLLLLVIHALLSWFGSVLADSEARAQFARTIDCRGTLIMGIGGLVLASAFVLVMCIRNPRVAWHGFPGQTALMWLPYLLFVAATIWDLGNLRHERAVATAFTFFVCAMTCFQIYLTWVPTGSMHVFWSTRMLYLTSGVSPVLPVLLLLAGAYWWAWVSLRGVCLVDLRRPRLPEKQDLPVEGYRISDTEGEELRRTAHPFLFDRQVLIPVMGMAFLSLTVLDHGHPVQTIEGKPYDWGFILLLGLMIATLVGLLLKLVWTWLKCRQVLAGLDRLPLRSAFGRMKDLSWHSFWNPGGSTLRETYKVMSRAMENLTRLLALVENWDTTLTDSARRNARTQIRKTLDARQGVIDAFGRIVADQKKKEDPSNFRQERRKVRLFARLRAIGRLALRFLNPAHYPRQLRNFWNDKKTMLKDDYKRGWRLKLLMKSVESLQKEMARTGAVMIRDVLKPWWDEEAAPAVSSDARLEKVPLVPVRAMAEEYAALVYVNFLVSVLLRIRTLVICAGGVYVFIVLAMNTYPYEPHPALQTLAVLLLVVMVGAVGYVYAEMHRESILSRLTSTAPGELGADFWIKLASAAAIPIFSLLASQFPSINQFLFSWLEPALQAMK